MSRKRLPSKIIELKGGVKHTHRPPREKEPQPLANIPRCPKHLDKVARKEWKRISQVLEPLGMISDLDTAVLAMYCENYSLWVDAGEKLRIMGMVKLTKKGYPVQNPYFSIMNKAKEQMLKCLIEMGCTPSSRSKVKVIPKEPEKNDKERFFK